MRCGRQALDPISEYDHYIRDLILVARCGDRDARYLFLQRYAEQLSGLHGYLAFLPDEEQRQIFSEALRCREGSWPKSLHGHRLAVPRWFSRRVVDPLAAWQENAGYRPRRVSIDPICGMLVDPDESPYVSRSGMEDVHFCCAECLQSYEQRSRDLRLIAS